MKWTCLSYGHFIASALCALFPGAAGAAPARRKRHLSPGAAVPRPALEKLLSFCLWGDGCAAALVTAEPPGIELDRFHCTVADEGRDLMRWDIGDHGFDMVLSGQVPAAVHETLRSNQGAIFGDRPTEAIDLWAVHPGGRSILDAVERALNLAPAALESSREMLRRYGNMSSATVMFVLENMLKAPSGLLGCGMSFGPGLTAETMLFRTVS
ncbi:MULTISPECIES: 3-oxoacyl-[acyl-carrier-protein] synthase III C-terminal domain-containing protein [Mesorhizobium]|uniref:3-oxoacyl-[acyl-carrier-protein] synthase III C-terminal domain-containing protein n=1 Tax=Mesorhizobium TaxID=68287 RepID=UPI001FE91B45|nr:MULTISPECIES: 3-oxoacyl-[acyl-carrier-protein] synthase III C-terminal domain-containing protein [Mesorhizobium]